MRSMSSILFVFALIVIGSNSFAAGLPLRSAKVTCRDHQAGCVFKCPIAGEPRLCEVVRGNCEAPRATYVYFFRWTTTIGFEDRPDLDCFPAFPALAPR